MIKIAAWRTWVVIIATVASLIYASPNFFPPSVRAGIPFINTLKPVNLGLDLQGGSYLLMEVDIPALRKQQLESVVDEMASTLQKAKPRIAYTGRGVAGDAARLRMVDPADAPRALEVLKKELVQQIDAGGLGRTAPNYVITQAADGAIEARFSPEYIIEQTRRAVDQSQEVVRRRIDPNGTSEVSINRQGVDRIVVQAPGESDPETLKRRIGKTARLTFHLLDERASLEDAAAGRAPPGSEIVPQEGRPDEPFLVIKSRALLSGDDLSRADPSFEQQTGQPVVSFKFNSRGSRIFGQITQQNVDKRFAVVLDGNVITAPNINEPILGGSGQISGNFTVESAKELADLLNAGALPAPLKIIEQRSVGAELGQDAINAGALAGIVASVAVVGFMVLAYGLFGVFACLALVINVCMIIAALSLAGATLSLPGIAGLVLTIGMAVDANVIIYERMREEQSVHGRGPVASLDTGFQGALITIIDSHLTQIGVALILFQFGHGPVRGFAWTLSIGVITSVFTATLVTQLFLAWWFNAVRPSKLPI